MKTCREYGLRVATSRFMQIQTKFSLFSLIFRCTLHVFCAFYGFYRIFAGFGFFFMASFSPTLGHSKGLHGGEAGGKIWLARVSRATCARIFIDPWTGGKAGRTPWAGRGPYRLGQLLPTQFLWPKYLAFGWAKIYGPTPHMER